MQPVNKNIGHVRNLKPTKERKKDRKKNKHKSTIATTNPTKRFEKKDQNYKFFVHQYY